MDVPPGDSTGHCTSGPEMGGNRCVPHFSRRNSPRSGTPRMSLTPPVFVLRLSAPSNFFERTCTQGSAKNFQLGSPFTLHRGKKTFSLLTFTAEFNLFSTSDRPTLLWNNMTLATRSTRRETRRNYITIRLRCSTVTSSRSRLPHPPFMMGRSAGMT